MRKVFGILVRVFAVIGFVYTTLFTVQIAYAIYEGQIFGETHRAAPRSAVDLTGLGVWGFYLYPILILACDALLKFGLGDETISERIWQHIPSRIAACSYIAFLGTLLFLHFGFEFLPG